MYLCWCCFVYLGICAGVVLSIHVFFAGDVFSIQVFVAGVFLCLSMYSLLVLQHQHKYIDRQNNTSTNT
jgi:hypothetical protein